MISTFIVIYLKLIIIFSSPIKFNKMKIIYFGLSLLFSLNLMAQEASWPKEINAESGELIVLYQPQLDSINSDRIKGRMAISIKTVQDSLIFVQCFSRLN